MFFLMIGFAAWNMRFGPGRRLAIPPFLAAALAGAMKVGLLSSFMDVPRVAFLVLLAALSMQPNYETRVSG